MTPFTIKGSDLFTSIINFTITFFDVVYTKGKTWTPAYVVEQFSYDPWACRPVLSDHSFSK